MALTREDVTKLYVASFNRAPDADGLNYWMNDSVITTLKEMAAAFMQSDEMVALYPTTQTNTEFVQLMYSNMFGRTAGATGLAYWVERLDDGTLPRESMIQALINGANASTGSASDRAILNNKTTVGLAYSNAGLNNVADATTVMANVGTSTLSVTLALSAVSVLQVKAVAAEAAASAAAVAAAAAAAAEEAAVVAAAEAAAAAAAAAAASASAAADAAAAAAAAALAVEQAGYTFTLTTSVDTFTGGVGPDIFNGTYDAGVVTDTFGFGGPDILDGGGGTDRLNISHPIGDTAITPPDALWTNISNIEEVVFTTTGGGAQTITTGVNFNTAFADGVDFTTTTSGAGAITIDMSTFTGVANITTVSTDGAHVITTGSGASTVNATSGAGELTISGANLTRVDALTTGAGAQTITSTGASNIVVNTTSQDGATSITTGAGDDTITLVGTSAGGANSITAGGGTNSITLYTNFSSVDTINFTVTGALATTASADTIVDFQTNVDKLSFDSITTITGGGTITAAAGTPVVSGAHGAVALTTNTIYVISDGADALTSIGTEIIANYTDLADVAAYLGEGYTSTADNSAAIFLINDLVGGKTYIYLFDEQTAGPSTIEVADLALIGIVNEATGAALIATDII